MGARCPELLVVLAGGAEMLGQGESKRLPPDLKSQPPGVELRFDGEVQPFAGGELFGAEVTLGQALSSDLQDGSLVTLLKFTENDAPAEDWLAGRHGLFYRFMSEVDAVMRARPGIRLAALVWAHGDADVADILAANLYYSRASTFFSDVRTALQRTTLPILVAPVSGQRASEYGRVPLVRAAQRELARQQGVYRIETRDLVMHYDNPAHQPTCFAIELGRRLATGLRPLLWGDAAID